MSLDIHYDDIKIQSLRFFDPMLKHGASMPSPKGEIEGLRLSLRGVKRRGIYRCLLLEGGTLDSERSEE